MYGILQALYSDILCSGIPLSGIHFVVFYGLVFFQHSILKIVFYHLVF